MTQALRHPMLVTLVAAWAAWMSASPGRALALPSESVSAWRPAIDREAQIDTIMSVMSRPDAQVHLRMAGMTPATLRDRLATLDDAQLAQVAERADVVKAGGILGVIIALLVIAILVLVILWMVDKDVDVEVHDDR